MRHWMFRCEDVSQKISQSMDMSLPWHQRLAVRFHLMMCRYCSRFEQQLILLRKAGRSEGSPRTDSDPSEKLSDEAKAKIKKKLNPPS